MVCRHWPAGSTVSDFLPDGAFRNGADPQPAALGTECLVPCSPRSPPQRTMGLIPGQTFHKENSSADVVPSADIFSYWDLGDLVAGRLFYFLSGRTISLVYLISWRRIFPSKFSVRDSKSILDLSGHCFVSGTRNVSLCVFALPCVIQEDEEVVGPSRQLRSPGRVHLAGSPSPREQPGALWTELWLYRNSKLGAFIPIAGSHLAGGGPWVPHSEKICKNAEVGTCLPFYSLYLRALLAEEEEPSCSRGTSGERGSNESPGLPLPDPPLLALRVVVSLSSRQKHTNRPRPSDKKAEKHLVGEGLGQDPLPHGRSQPVSWPRSCRCTRFSVSQAPGPG